VLQPIGIHVRDEAPLHERQDSIFAFCSLGQRIVGEQISRIRTSDQLGRTMTAIFHPASDRCIR
jgi:hypothetical protein